MGQLPGRPVGRSVRIATPDCMPACSRRGIDFVEEDSCHHAETAKDPHAKDGQPILYSELYGRMLDALNKTGRPIVFYMCVQGQENVQEWGPTTGNLWRTTGDICGPGHATWGGVIRNFYGDTRYQNSTMVGAWRDPDSAGFVHCFRVCCRQC